jgi:hypothetical protein
MKILAIQHKASAVFQYRMNRPLGNFDTTFRRDILRKGEKIQIGDLAKRFARYGKIWVFKYLDHFHTLDVLHSMKNEVGAKIVVDIDDNIWQIPIGNIARGNEKENANRGLMMTLSVQEADYITVSTEPLKNALKTLNDNIVVLPNYIDPKEWTFKRIKHDKVRIGWVYSPTHFPDIEPVKKAMEEIAKRDDVEIVIFGTDKDIFDFHTTNIPAVKYDKYPETFMREGIDISIAPLLDNDFNRCKSNIKWLESTMAGACFVGSKVYPYEKSIREGKNGYLAKSSTQWVKRLTWLIENKDKREELVATAKKEVLQRAKEDKQKWIDFYESIDTSSHDK